MKATDRKLWIPLLGGAAIILGSFGLVFRDHIFRGHCNTQKESTEYMRSIHILGAGIQY